MVDVQRFLYLFLTISFCSCSQPGANSEEAAEEQPMETMISFSARDVEILGPIDFQAFQADGEMASGRLEMDSSDSSCDSNDAAVIPSTGDWLRVDARSEAGWVWQMEGMIGGRECLEVSLGLASVASGVAAIVVGDPNRLPARVSLDGVHQGDVTEPMEYEAFEKIFEMDGRQHLVELTRMSREGQALLLMRTPGSQILRIDLADGLSEEHAVDFSYFSTFSVHYGRPEVWK